MSSLIKTVFGMLEKTQLKSINCTITSKRKDSFDPKCWDVKSPKHVYQNLETTVKGNYNTISFYSHSLHGNPASRLFVSVLCALEMFSALYIHTNPNSLCSPSPILQRHWGEVDDFLPGADGVAVQAAPHEQFLHRRGWRPWRRPLHQTQRGAGGPRPAGPNTWRHNHFPRLRSALTSVTFLLYLLGWWSWCWQ